MHLFQKNNNQKEVSAMDCMHALDHANVVVHVCFWDWDRKKRGIFSTITNILTLHLFKQKEALCDKMSMVRSTQCHTL